MRKGCLDMHFVATGSKSITLISVSLLIPLEEQQIVGTGGSDGGTGWINGPRPRDLNPRERRKETWNKERRTV